MSLNIDLQCNVPQSNQCPLSLGIVFVCYKQRCSDPLCTFLFTHLSDGSLGTRPHGWRGWSQGFGQSQSPVSENTRAPEQVSHGDKRAGPPPPGGGPPGPDLLSPDPPTWTEAQTLVAPVSWCHQQVRPGSLVIWRQVSVWWVTWLHREAELQGRGVESPSGSGRRGQVRRGLQNLRMSTSGSLPGRGLQVASSGGPGDAPRAGAGGGTGLGCSGGCRGPGAYPPGQRR